MRITLEVTKSAQENAARYYEEAKDARKKIEGLEKAIEETKKEMEKAKKEQEKKRQETKIKKEKKWFEKFRWFFTSKGKLAVGGRDAESNDLVFARHMDEKDLFFHADIQGGSALILKDGEGADEQERKECAQFAASFSNAWKNGNASVDVYCVKKQQISKYQSGGYIPAGGFGITGEREWFRGTKLGLKLGKGENGLEIIPECSERKLEQEVQLIPAQSGKEKGQIAKSLAKRWGAHPDELLQILPSGKMKTKL